MAFPVFQNPFDWTTQYWNILLGRRVHADSDKWLIGPVGKVGETAEDFISRLAEEHDLEVRRSVPGSGLIDDFGPMMDSIHPEIRSFYHHTVDYHLDVWTEWKPVFGSFGWLISRLFSRRIQQLNLPQSSLETASGIKSEIISLVNSNNQTIYRIWYRSLKKTNEVVFYGIYSDCVIPSGDFCIKTIFPLPQGSATVIFSMNPDSQGHLELTSSGESYNDSGFYFLVNDGKRQLWKHYIKGFHEKIYLYIDDENVLRADHTMTLWGWRIYSLHYKMMRKQGTVV